MKHINKSIPARVQLNDANERKHSTDGWKYLILKKKGRGNNRGTFKYECILTS